MELFKARSYALQQIAKVKQPIAIWGAAGKGIVLAHALKLTLSVPIIAIDADFHRWSKYLECFGVEILSPAKSIKHSSKDMLILVSNPNHLEQVKTYPGNRFDVGIPSKFTS